MRAALPTAGDRHHEGEVATHRFKAQTRSEVLGMANSEKLCLEQRQRQDLISKALNKRELKPIERLPYFVQFFQLCPSIEEPLVLAPRVFSSIHFM